MTHIAPPTNKRLFFERRSQFSHYRGIFRVVRACSTKIQSTGWAPSRLAAVPRRNGSTSSQCQLPLKSLGRFAPAADGWNPPSTSMAQHMLRSARTSALRLSRKCYWTNIGRSMSSVSSFSALRQSGVLKTWHTCLPGLSSRVSTSSPAHSRGRRTQHENAAISRQPAVCQSFGSP